MSRTSSESGAGPRRRGGGNGEQQGQATATRSRSANRRRRRARRKKAGAWTLHEPIGLGGQSRVYRATKGEAGEVAAVKQITASYPKKRDRFIQEVKVHVDLAKSGNSNIVPILDHDLKQLRNGGVSGYIAMPLAQQSLEACADLLRMRVELALEVFRGVIRGVQAAHAARVVHRDIKPGNVLFLDGSLRTPLLTDFGICLLSEATDADRLTGVHETVGAKFFMAPEQERGGVADVNEAADIYALGKLLHWMLTSRHLYREELHRAFQDDELERDPRLRRIFDRILARTICEDPCDRIQTADDLLAIVDELLDSFRNPPPNGRTAAAGKERPSGDGSSEDLPTAYSRLAGDLAAGKIEAVGLEFDQLLRAFRNEWKRIHKDVETTPERAADAAIALLRAQPRATAATLALARCDTKSLFLQYKRFLEALAKETESLAGYVSVAGIPHIQAGFLYMAAAVMALHHESWNFLARLLSDKFELFYRSGRPLYYYGFAHPYFFHSEAIRRDGAKSHDLIRAELTQPAITGATGLEGDDLLNTYVFAQMVMCLRAAQLCENEEDVRSWADFGRFDEWRVLSFLDRAYSDREYGQGLLLAFEESPEEFFGKLNARLRFIADRFFRGTNYFWSSVHKWEPR